MESNRHGDATFTKERLDRVVANQAWAEMCTNMKVEVLAARSSDHKPLILYHDNHVFENNLCSSTRDIQAGYMI